MGKKNKGGRPSIYPTKIKPYLKYIAAMREDGMTHGQIAAFLGVSLNAYDRHKKEIEEFGGTIKNADDVLVEDLESSLYGVALGKVKSTTTEYVYKGKKKVKMREKVSNPVPDKTALFFLLNNLRPEKWKHRNEVKITDDNDNVVPSFAEVLKGKLDE